MKTKKVIRIAIVAILASLFVLNFVLNAVATSDKVLITMQIGNNTAYVDGALVSLDVPPQIIKGRTLVPIRFVSENLGAEVGWESNTKTVTITMDSIPYLKNRISSLEAEKTDLTTKNNSLQKENTDLTTKVSELQKQITDLLTENKELKDKISEMQEPIKIDVSKIPFYSKKNWISAPAFNDEILKHFMGHDGYSCAKFVQAKSDVEAFLKVVEPYLHFGESNNALFLYSVLCDTFWIHTTFGKFYLDRYYVTFYTTEGWYVVVQNGLEKLESFKVSDINLDIPQRPDLGN